MWKKLMSNCAHMSKKCKWLEAINWLKVLANTILYFY